MAPNKATTRNKVKQQHLLDLCRRHGSDISLCPSADATNSNAGRRLIRRKRGTSGNWRPFRQLTKRIGNPAAMPVKTARNLQQRSDAAMAFMPTSLQTLCLRARQVGIRCERLGRRQRQARAQARLATEGRARQPGRCPAHSENRLCRGKPHGRRQGGKDLASDRGRCATLQSAKHATPKGAGWTSRSQPGACEPWALKEVSGRSRERENARSRRNFGHGGQGTAEQ